MPDPDRKTKASTPRTQPQLSEFLNLLHQRGEIEAIMDAKEEKSKDWQRILECRKSYLAATNKEKSQFVGQALEDLRLNKAQINTATFTLLAVLFAADSDPFYQQDFDRYLEDIDPENDLGLNEEQAESLSDYIDELEKSRGDIPYYALSVILNFISHFLECVQEKIPEAKYKVPPSDRKRYGVIYAITEVAEHKEFLGRLNDTQNSILNRRFREIIELSFLYSVDRVNWIEEADLRAVENRLSNASAYMMWRLNLITNYKARLKYGFYKGEPTINHPLLPIAPGYLATYKKGGSISTFYRVVNPMQDQTLEAKKVIQSNQRSEHQALYEKLRTIETDGDRLLENHGVVLPVDWRMAKMIDIDLFESTSEEAPLYDLDAIGTDYLHPFVLARLIDANIAALAEKNKGPTFFGLEKVDKEELLRELKTEGATQDDLLQWEMLMGLSIRTGVSKNKRVFGEYEDLSQYPFWIQYSYLRFLASLNSKQRSKLDYFITSGSLTEERIITLGSMRGDPKAVELLLTTHHGGYKEDETPIFDKLSAVQPLFKTYARIIISAREAAVEIGALYKEILPNKPTQTADFFNSIVERNKALLLKAIDEIHEAKDSKEKMARYRACAERFEYASQTIAHTVELVATLTQEERKKLDLEALSTTEIHSVPATDLWKPEYDSIREQMIATIKANFPSPKDVDDFKRLLNDPRATIHFSTVDGELICFFASIRIGEETYQLDDFCRAVGGPVGRLAQATLFSVNVKQDQFKRGCLAAKPHVALAMAVENGFLVDGITHKRDGYTHNYMECRKLDSEQREVYLGQNLTDEHKGEIKDACGTPHQLQPLTLEGRALEVCRVEFHNRSYKDNILPHEEDYWIYKTVHERCSTGDYVMSGYFEDEARSKDHKIYYAVFEPFQGDEQEQKNLERDRAKFYQKRTQRPN